MIRPATLNDDGFDGHEAEPEEMDPIVEAMEKTPEGEGLVRWSWTADAIQSFISDIVSDLTFPMSTNLLAQRLAELDEWWAKLDKVA